MIFNLLRKPSKIFIKYLLSYLAILLVPLFIIGIFGAHYIKSIDNEKVIDNDFASLTEAAKEIDKHLIQISQIVFEMSGNQDLWCDGYKENIRKVLSDYTIPHIFLLKMFFYRKGAQVIYSSEGSYKLSIFINKKYNYRNWDYDDFYNHINSISSPFVRPAENVDLNTGKTERYVTYLLPLNSFTQQYHGTALFMIPEESFLSIFSNVLKGYKSNTIVLNRKDELITALKKDSIFYYKLLNYLKLAPEYSDVETVITQRQGYYIIYSTSGYSGLKYVTITQVHEIESKANRLRKNAIYSLILIIIIGGSIICFFLHFNYNPIKRLKECVEKIGTPKKVKINKIDAIRSVIENISEHNVRLQTRIKSNKVAVKEYLLFSLLRSQIKNRDEFNSKGLEIGLFFSRPDLFIILFHLDKKGVVSNQDLLIIIDDLEQNMPAEFEGYGMESIDGKQLIFIMSTEENKGSTITDQVMLLKELLQKKWGISSSIGVGSRYAKYREVGKSYLEASTALDYCFMIGRNTIILYNDFKLNKLDIKSSYPYTEFEEFEKYMINGNTTGIENVIMRIIFNIKNTNLPTFMIKSVCFDIIRIIRKTLSNINGESSINIDIFHDVLSLTEFTTVDDLYDLILMISKEICNLITEKKEYINSALINRIFNYIKENYTDFKFSIQSAADYFEMSITNFSHYFKLHAKCKFIDYTSNMCIAKAKKLLSDTDIPIKEMVKVVGYHDESSFIRKFKKIVGITPGKYKNEYKIQ